MALRVMTCDTQWDVRNSGRRDGPVTFKYTFVESLENYCATWLSQLSVKPVVSPQTYLLKP